MINWPTQCDRTVCGISSATETVGPTKLIDNNMTWHGVVGLSDRAHQLGGVSPLTELVGSTG